MASEDAVRNRIRIELGDITRLTVEAIRTRSRATAVDALMAHPLVLSYSRAKPLVDEYLAAHRDFVGEWGP